MWLTRKSTRVEQANYKSHPHLRPPPHKPTNIMSAINEECQLSIPVELN